MLRVVSYPVAVPACCVPFLLCFCSLLPYIHLQFANNGMGASFGLIGLGYGQNGIGDKVITHVLWSADTAQIDIIQGLNMLHQVAVAKKSNRINRRNSPIIQYIDAQLQLYDFRFAIQQQQSSGIANLVLSTNSETFMTYVLSKLLNQFSSLDKNIAFLPQDLDFVQTAVLLSKLVQITHRQGPTP